MAEKVIVKILSVGGTGNRLSIKIDQLIRISTYYDKIKVYRAATQAGDYAEITIEATRIDIVPEAKFYFYDDDDGTSSQWYKVSWYNSATTKESSQSEERKADTEEAKIGYTFKNYSAPPDEWGEALTPDDMRYTFLWGIELIASDELASQVENDQIRETVNFAVGEFERDFMIDIKKRIYKTQPAAALVQAVEWIEGVDYTDEEEPYDFDKVKWGNYGFLQLRHKPIISVEDAGFYSPWDTKVLDINDWLRIYKKSGQLNIFPRGNILMGSGYTGMGILAVRPEFYARKYPQGYKFDYTTGYKNSDFVPKDLRSAIGTLAAINMLAWVGDGLMAGFSSSSVSLDGLSESFSSTQSATSAYFGARIKQYIDYLKRFVKTNKYKYANIPIGFVPGS